MNRLVAAVVLISSFALPGAALADPPIGNCDEGHDVNPGPNLETIPAEGDKCHGVSWEGDNGQCGFSQDGSDVYVACWTDLQGFDRCRANVYCPNAGPHLSCGGRDSSSFANADGVICFNPVTSQVTQFECP